MDVVPKRNPATAIGMGRLAPPRSPARCAGQPHPRPAAIEVPLAFGQCPKASGEYLAARPEQLAPERGRSPPNPERARRPALDQDVHRVARQGPQILISGTWHSLSRKSVTTWPRTAATAAALGANAISMTNTRPLSVRMLNRAMQPSADRQSSVQDKGTRSSRARRLSSALPPGRPLTAPGGGVGGGAAPSN